MTTTMTGGAPTYFTHEAAVVAALETVPGILVRTAVAAEEAVELSTAQPTAVVVFESDEVISSKNPYACVVARRVSVYLLMQGPTVERQAEDGELLHAIWVALHGLEIDGYDEPMLFEGSDSEVVSGCRDYRMVFKTQTTLRVPEGVR